MGQGQIRSQAKAGGLTTMSSCFICTWFYFYVVLFYMVLFSAHLVCKLLMTSGLSPEQLASIWNLSDMNRDARISIDEFAIACHLTRYLKTGSNLAVVKGCSD